MKPRVIAEGGVMIALALVLSYIRIYHLPQGGSITAGSMVPILIFALRRERWVAIVVAILYGVVQFLQEPIVYHPVQVLLDYPIAFGALGLATLFKKQPVLGVVVGIAGRFIAHLCAGAIFFAEYAPEGMSPWIYSAIYNGSYLLGELVVSVILIYILIKKGILELYK
ncbi:MAG: energy-coupled thiamine transporter ThiT [Candidatus Methanofastidiosia archaeon]